MSRLRIYQLTNVVQYDINKWELSQSYEIRVIRMEEGNAMRKMPKLSAILLIFLVIACLTQQAYARLTAGPVYYDTTGTCGKSLLFTVKDGVMRIQGTGDMYDYDGGHMQCPWDSHAFTKIVVEPGVTSIGAYAFSYRSDNGSPITEIQLPDTLNRIGKYAFDSCNSLAELKLPSSLIVIDQGAFEGCCNLTNITLPAGLITLGDGAFRGCSSLTELNIPDSVINIGSQILEGTAVPPPYPTPNMDIPAAWARSQLEEAAASGLTTEHTNTGYRRWITREQLAELAVQMAEKLTGTSLTPSSKDTFWDTESVSALKAAAAGIVDGKDAHHFVPDGNASREEIAAILCRTAFYVEEHSQYRCKLNTMTGVPAQYMDKARISAWAVPYVAGLADSGILTGTTAATLSPQAPTSVQEAIVLVLRLYRHILG